jgi:hypothetical protein
MQHIYNVYPPRHQPQWPANDNKREPSITFKLLMGIGIALCMLMLPAAVVGGLMELARHP